MIKVNKHYDPGFPGWVITLNSDCGFKIVYNDIVARVSNKTPIELAEELLREHHENIINTLAGVIKEIRQR